MQTPGPVNSNPSPASSPGLGYVSEMFCSIQGEGPFVGERHVFVRTAGCSAACWWCDTVYSKVETPRFVVHDERSGKRAKRALDNPLDLDTLSREVGDFVRANEPVDAVSLTGGEPLEQPRFVTALARRLHDAGLRVYLETNGVHADALADILPYIDVVAMDIKLPSAVGEALWDDHRRFLGVIRGTDFEPGRNAGRAIFVKVVVDGRSCEAEIARAAQLIAEVSPAIPLILQPESGTLFLPRTPRETAVTMMATIEAGQRVARRVLDVVRVMPQVHKILKVR